MEIHATRSEDGKYLLQMGYVTFELTKDAVSKLKAVISSRLNQSSIADINELQKKITIYKQLANKLVHSKDRIVQEFAVKLTPPQLVTLARLADGEMLLNKIVKNLSKQNGKQFENDFTQMHSITEYQAIINMEKIIPIIRQSAKNNPS